MLELIVFTCGAGLMGLEFVAARMLAPTLGSSLFVWGAVISIVMAALSIGYALGGWVADRFGSTRTLAPVIAAAGVATVLVPGLTTLVLPMVAGLGTRTGSLVASAAVFFAPSLLLAMVSPLGVRLATGNRIEHVGRSAGQLYAISTAGSIAGTIATAFWLIPLLTLDGLVVAIGFALFAAALLALLLPRRYDTTEMPDGTAAPTGRPRRGLAAVTLALVALGGLLGSIVLVDATREPAVAENGERVIFRTDTQYHRLAVTEEGGERLLRFDRSRQSGMYLDDAFDTSFRYPKYLHLTLAYAPEAKRVLVLGLGGGTVVKRMWRDYPQVSIDAVEIDPVVVDVATRYFDVPRDPRIRLITEDARRYLASTEKTYDIIIADAYYADSLPSHLTTVEFFRLAKDHLNPGGVLAYNVIGSVEGEDSKLFRSMYRTASEVWEGLDAFPIGLGASGDVEQRRNVIVLASDTPPSRGALLDTIASRVDGRVSISGFERFGADLLSAPVATDDVPLLTDQHAPTDALIRVQ